MADFYRFVKQPDKHGSDEFAIMGPRSESHREERRRRRRVFRAVLTVPRGHGGPLTKSLKKAERRKLTKKSS
jgi:hypothetical protein